MTDLAAEVRRHLVPYLPSVLGEAAARLDLDLLAERLSAYAALLVEANTHLNLTRILDPEGLAFRHLLDSLLALPLLGGTGPVLDLGTGGGVPGVPLALAQPERSFLLCESRGKKARALQQIVEQLGLAPRVGVSSERAESVLRSIPVDVVVVRAVAAVPALLQLLAPVRARFAHLVLYKGPGVDDELDLARPQFAALGFVEPERTERSLPGEHGRRVLLTFAGARG